MEQMKRITDVPVTSADENAQVIVNVDGTVKQLPVSELQKGGPAPSIEIDATLTESNKAADAKVVGEKIGELYEEIAELKGETDNEVTSEVIKPTWLHRNVNSSGEFSNSTQIRVSCEITPVPDGGILIEKSSETYKANVYMFFSNGTFTKHEMKASDTSFTVDGGYAIVRMNTQNVNGDLVVTFDEIDSAFTLTGYYGGGKVSEAKKGNALYGKKWAVCGDSFTAGDFAGDVDEADSKFTSGVFEGQNKVYARHIAMRNDMRLQWMAHGGKTLASPADGSIYNSFTNLNSKTGNRTWKNYQDIDEDVDYITFYFGINDSHHEAGSTGDDGESKQGVIPLGAIDDTDTSTFYGAWNVMLLWLMENRPFAHMGILVSNGCDRDAYRFATIEIAKKWGVPYIDLNGDERTPVMLRSTNPDISDAVKTIKRAKQGVSEENGHPNVKTHLFESWFIEDFLRSL